MFSSVRFFLNLNLRDDFYLLLGDQIEDNQLIESSLKIEGKRIGTISKGDDTYFSSRRGTSIFISSSKIKFSINVRLTESNLKIEPISRRTIHIPQKGKDLISFFPTTISIYIDISIYVAQEKLRGVSKKRREKEKRNILREESFLLFSPLSSLFIRGNSFFRNGQMLKRSNA